MDGNLTLNLANFSTLFVCMVLKFPQIFVLMRARATAGVSLNSLLLELVGFLVFMSYQMYYDYPPLTYLEYPILIAQDVIVLLLILHYNRNLKHSLIYAALFVGGWQLLTVQKWVIDLAMRRLIFSSLILAEACSPGKKLAALEEALPPSKRPCSGPAESPGSQRLALSDCRLPLPAIPGVSSWVLRTISLGYSLQFARRPPRFGGVIQTTSLCTFISASSKLAQLQCLWSSKDSRQVSSLTWGLATYTCLARIFTTVVTTGDTQVLIRFVVMTVLNMWVTVTVIYYKPHAVKRD
ncbi:PQ-loop repeat-containing protein 3 [Anabarilius grahami]|uniref:PQ-loop repeat-containing protein 3 n=1 Tax=Anabarilius grahami TaxID=495550 RepID=A0A3N0YTY9_ANAGA|nr:PQ-loop repeat-containing protein 3 [Anabarilius grahami]